MTAGDDTAINSLHRADTLPMGVVPDQAAEPVDGTVYVVRRLRGHLVAGRVLARIDAPTGKQARSRAARHLGVPLLPWQLLDEDDPDAGWWTASGLLVEQYAVFEHASRWLLLGDVTRSPHPHMDVLRTETPMSRPASTWFSSDS